MFRIFFPYRGAILSDRESLRFSKFFVKRGNLKRLDYDYSVVKLLSSEESFVTSWTEIVREHGPPTYRVAWRILRHAQDCEDVLQEVFIEAHKLFECGEISHPRTLLSRMATFRAIDLLRKRREASSIDDPSAGSLRDESLNPEHSAINREETLRLRSIVADLPPRQAAVFCLVHFEELSHDETATTLNISKGAVAMALHKARAKLREVFIALKEFES